MDSSSPAGERVTCATVPSKPEDEISLSLASTDWPGVGRVRLWTQLSLLGSFAHLHQDEQLVSRLRMNATGTLTDTFTVTT